MQIIVIAAEIQYHCLKPFDYLANKYLNVPAVGMYHGVEFVLCGYAEPDLSQMLLPWEFYSIGSFADYPPHKWSDALLKVLDEVADEQFVLMLEDYWIIRPVDVTGMRMCFDYCAQYRNVLKIDLAFDRLYSQGHSPYYGGSGDYAHLGYLDLIKSPPGTDYQMSLWGGVWNREVLKEFVVPGEKAQLLEMNGTRRVNAVGDEVLVLGTRQAPLRHGNIYRDHPKGVASFHDNGWAIDPSEVDYMREQGWLE